MLIPSRSSPGSEFLGEIKGGENLKGVKQLCPGLILKTMVHVPFPNILVSLGNTNMKVFCNLHTEQKCFESPRQHHSTDQISWLLSSDPTQG